MFLFTLQHGIIKVFGEEFIIMPIIESADAPAAGQQNSVKHGIGKLRGNKALDFGRDYVPVPSKFNFFLSVMKKKNYLFNLK